METKIAQDSERMVRALSVFEQALDQDDRNRAAWIEQACQGDAKLMEEVLRNLAAHRQSEQFLNVAQMPTQTIGPYRLLHSIGRGGMGEVYLAERADGAYDQKVAVKLIHAQLLSPELRARALAERQFLAELTHPNIARLMDAGSSEAGQLYVVMEYIEGQNIDKFANQNQLDVQARVRLFLKVLDAIDAAHRSLIIHRDLKSANILVNQLGEPKLLDFGIAKSLGSDQASQTQTGHLLLTPSNASPEQLEGKSLDTTSDVYSACTVLFQLLTGRLPREFEGQASFEAARSLADTAPPKLANKISTQALGLSDAAVAAWHKQLQGDLEAIVSKALRYEPDKRYRSAREFADDLQRWLDHRPVLARQGGKAYAASKFIQRNRWPLALAGAVLLALTAGLGAAWHQGTQRLKEAERTQSVKAFLADVISRADPFTEGGALTVAQALDQASSEVEQRFSTSPVLEAEVRHLLGRAYLGRDELDKAKAQFERALQLAQAQQEKILWSTSLSGLAQINWSNGDVDQAVSQYQLANTLLDANDLEQRYNMLSNKGDLVQIASDRGEVEHSIALAKEALDEWRIDPENALRSKQQYAMLLSHNGFALHGDPKRLQEAADYYRRSLTQWRKLLKADNLEVAAIENNEAKARLDLGQLDAAIALLESSLKTRDRLLPAKHWMRVNPYSNLANVYSKKGEHARACELLQTAFKNANAALTEGDPAWIRLLDNSMRIALARGDLQQAKALAERALSMPKALSEVEPERVQRLRESAVLDAPKTDESCTLDFRP